MDVSDVMSDGKWHFWAFVYDFGYGYRIYRDGALAAESPWTASAGVTTRGFYPRRTFGIGKASWNGFMGRSAEVSLWREPLGATTGKKLHPMTLSGPVWVQDESFRLPSYEEWLHSKATIILVR